MRTVVAHRLLALLAGLASATPGVAQFRPFEASPQFSNAPSPVLGGMWVQIDGRGRLGTMSNPAIPQAISRLISQNSRGLRVVERKSGRLSMALDGRFLRAMVAHVEDDGSVVTSCDSDLLLGAAVDEGKE
jgi:hypothetical protein